MTAETFTEWVILEIMGHRRLAGHLSEQEIAGQGFLRLDIPDGPSQFYAPAAIYCITPTTEEIAREFARHHQPQPANRWELPALTEPAHQSEIEVDHGFYDDDLPL